MSDRGFSKLLKVSEAVPKKLLVTMVLVMIGLTLVASYALYTQGGDNVNSTVQSSFRKSQGILYVYEESFQAEGVSMALAGSSGGGPTQPITTTNEWWIDAQNPWRFRRVTTELLEHGPQIAVSDGSNGTDAWWELAPYKGSNQVVRHAGRYPLLQGDKQGRTEMTLDIWLENFANAGASVLARVQRGEAQQIDQREAAPWGKLLVIQQTMKNKIVRTNTVQADAPHVLVEMVDKNPDGQTIQTKHITRWEWHDPSQFKDDFWMNPPAPGSPSTP